jgi:hypothetical protein
LLSFAEELEGHGINLTNETIYAIDGETSASKTGVSGRGAILCWVRMPESRTYYPQR